MQRRVGGAERQIHEEGTAGVGLLLVANVGNGVIDQIFRQMIAGTLGRIDEMIVLHQQRRPLVGLAAQKAVIFFKTHAERPVIERPRRGVGGVGREVPFAQGHGVVAILLQHFGDRAGALGDRSIAAGIARRGLGDRGEADLVMVAAGQQRAARGRAQSRGVEIIVAQPFGGEPVEVGRLDRPAIGRKLPVADVVEHDEDDVRRACRRRDRHGRTEIRDGVLVGLADLAFELGRRNGKDFAARTRFRRMAPAVANRPTARLNPRRPSRSVSRNVCGQTSRRAKSPDTGEAVNRVSSYRCPSRVNII